MSRFPSGFLVGAVSVLAALQVGAADRTNSPPADARISPVATTRPLGPITVQEASLAETNVITPKPGPGTWRQSHVIDAMDIVETNITYEWHGSDGRDLMRSEETHFAKAEKNSKHQPHPTIIVRNEEGSWTLHERVAILSPRSGTGASGQKNAASTDILSKDDDELLDDPQIATNMIVTGERIKQGERVLLLISSTIGEKAQQRLDTLIDQKIKQARKEAPLLLRPLLAAFPLKKMFLKIVPLRTEKLIDEDTQTLIVERGYNRDGHLVMQEWAWTPCPDLPRESYHIPKNLKLLRPKTSKQADTLEADARKEDEKLRAKSH